MERSPACSSAMVGSEMSVRINFLICRRRSVLVHLEGPALQNSSQNAVFDLCKVRTAAGARARKMNEFIQGDASALDEDDAIGQSDCFGDVMRDQHGRKSLIPPDTFD